MPTQRVIPLRKVLCVLVGLICLAALAVAQEEKVKLELKLPKPQFSGTKQPPKGATNLEPEGTKRPPILLPKGTQNVASKKPVTASDEEPTIGELKQVTDGDKEAADGSFVELGPGTQWVQVDLGQPHEIFAVVVWHYHQQARVYKDIVIQVADDADFIKNVRTAFNNDHDNSSGLGIGKDKEYLDTCEGRPVDCKGVKGRYVRLYSNGNTSNDVNHYIEVEVYGRPAK